MDEEILETMQLNQYSPFVPCVGGTLVDDQSNGERNYPENDPGRYDVGPILFKPPQCLPFIV